MGRPGTPQYSENRHRMQLVPDPPYFGRMP
jgi:hypothetical protein